MTKASATHNRNTGGEDIMNEWAAVVGVDWGDREHAFEVVSPVGSSGRGERGKVKQTPGALVEWVMGLRSKYPEGRIAIAVEQSRGAFIHAMMGYDFVDLMPLNPAQVASYRAALRPSGAKDDPFDAGVVGQFTLKHPQSIRVWKAQDPVTRELDYLTQWRRKLVDQRTAAIQQTVDALKQYYPQAIEWGGESGSPMWCDFLEQWPTLDQVRRARPDTIRRFYTEHHSRSASAIERRIAEMASAVALTTDAAILAGRSLLVGSLAKLIASLSEQIAVFDQRIGELWQSHPDRAVFESLPGAGRILAPRLAAALGTDRSRWDACSLQRFSGIAPIVTASGATYVVQARHRCPKFVRQTFHEFALHSIGFSLWAEAFYQEQRKRGKGHHAAVRALAFRWIRIIVACWKSGTPYDEARYLERLRTKHSPYAIAA